VRNGTSNQRQIDVDSIKIWLNRRRFDVPFLTGLVPWHFRSAIINFTHKLIQRICSWRKMCEQSRILYINVQCAISVLLHRKRPLVLDKFSFFYVFSVNALCTFSVDNNLIFCTKFFVQIFALKLYIHDAFSQMSMLTYMCNLLFCYFISYLCFNAY